MAATKISKCWTLFSSSQTRLRPNNISAIRSSSSAYCSDASEITNSKTEPMADSELWSILKPIVKQCADVRQTVCGVRKVIRSVHKGSTDVVILSADTDPIDLVLPVAELCVKKKIPYIFVPSKDELGRLCKLMVATTACSLKASEIESGLDNRILALKDTIQAYHSW